MYIYAWEWCISHKTEKLSFETLTQKTVERCGRLAEKGNIVH